MAPNTASLLPIIPRIFFLYIEPVLITIGMIKQYATTHALFAATTSSAPAPLPVPALAGPALSAGYLLSMMLYGLMVLLAAPPSATLLRLHIGVLVVADLTHWAGLLATLARAHPRGWAGALDTAAWSADTWDLARFPLYTLAVKGLTLAGAFGRIGG
ncbi:hypothetical protein F4809DRAFT_655350 [Biscogniauxia mediterranea]|nr:hypothetical protein F4809DRAFT_655350 [Biscogniauxia mediterranea]